MALAGCYVRVERDVPKAIQTLEAAQDQLEGKALPVSMLLSTLLQEVKRLPSDKDRAEVREGSLRLPEYVSVTQDWLVTPGYLTLVFIISYLPCIGANYPGSATPVIRLKELEEAKDRGLEKDMKTFDRSDDLIRVLNTLGDRYTTVMNLVVAQARTVTPDAFKPMTKLPDRLQMHRRKASPQQTRDVRDYVHDWTTNGLSTRTRPSKAMRHGSLPVAETEYISKRRTAVGRSRLKPRGRSRQVDSSESRRQIMVEFTPERISVGNEIVNIQALPLIRNLGEKSFPQDSLKRAQIERLQDISIASSGTSPPRAEDSGESIET